MRHPLLSLILVSLAGCGERVQGEACMLAPEDGVCPAAEDFTKDDINDPWDCDHTVTRITHTGAPDVSESVFQDGSEGCMQLPLLDPQTLHQVTTIGIRQVLAPAASALLAA